MAPYALTSEKHMAPCARRSKVTAGPVVNLPVLYCHNYWTVPKEEEKMTEERTKLKRTGKMAFELADTE